VPRADQPSATPALRVVQLSDTHLSPVRAYSVPNVVAILEWLASDPPDVVVHTGDITADDPDDTVEADFARRLLLEPGLPIHAIPGNHDVGGFTGDPVTPARLDAFVARWGTDHWVVDRGAWRLVAANVYRLDDAEHVAWLAEALTTERPCVLFLHQPICLTHPDRPDAGDWSLAMRLRRPLLDAMAGRPVRVVASGHLHRYGTGELPGGIVTIWSPAASFGMSAGRDPDDPSGDARVGVVEHHLAADGTASHRVVIPPGVADLSFRAVVPPGSHGLRDAPLLPLRQRL
jgi:3',5'-cyclic AMP phosphodiesterase CpdA